MNKDLPNRKSLRLKEYDYSTPGGYFITLCTHNRKNTLSHILRSAEIVLTPYGKIVDGIIRNLPQHLGVSIDRYVIMPNHIHLIVMIDADDTLRAIHESPLRCRSAISKAVGYIKMNASKQIHTHFGPVDVWQRGFYDHVIRNQADYEAIAKYVWENPLRWELDKLYSAE